MVTIEPLGAKGTTLNSSMQDPNSKSPDILFYSLMANIELYHAASGHLFHHG